MAENKTKRTGASVDGYIASRASDQQDADCRKLMTLFRRVTRQPPTMWGPSIVGYGRYRYTYESGRTGEAPVTGFAIRGREIVLYVMTEGETQRSLLATLGTHRIGKSCLYIRRLSEVDYSVLETVVANSVAEVKRRYGEEWSDAH